MKHFSEGDLIAYHLHELSPRRSRALEAVLRSDASLAAESRAYAAMLGSFKGGTPLDVDEDVMDRNWEKLWAKLPGTPLRTSVFPRRLVPALAGLGLAFAAAVFFVTTRRPATPAPTAPSARGVTESIPSFRNSLPANATRSNPNGRQRTFRSSHIPFLLSPADSPIARLHDAPPRIIPAVPDREDPVPVLQYIPLARVPLSLPPAPSASAVAADAVSPQVTLGADNASRQKQQRKADRRDRYMEVTLAMGGTLIGTRNVSSSNGQTRTQGATHAVVAIGSFHQQLRRAVGYRFTASYTRPDFQYNSSTGQTDIVGRVYEFAGTYVVQGPHRGIVSTTVEGGTALMAFLPEPNSSGITAGANLRAAGILGVGAEIGVTKHLAINTSYRVQIFKGPDFRSSNNTGLPTIATTLISNEPAVGISYRFARK